MTTATLATETVPLAGGRELRCIVVRDETGAVVRVLVSDSWPGAALWPISPRSIELDPADIAAVANALTNIDKELRA